MPREVFGQFEHLAIAQLDSGIQLQNENKTGIATARIKISGAGGPFAEIAREKINGVNAPFVFRWEKQGWIPWSWHLVNVENPELEIPAP